MISTTRVLAGALFAGALVLTGCSDDSVASHMDSMESGSAESTGASAGDVTFGTPTSPSPRG